MYRLGLGMAWVCAACAAPAPVTGDVVGAWRFLPRDPARSPVEEREVVELRADHTFAITNKRGAQVGTFEIDGNELTIQPEGGAWISTGIAATTDRLVIDAVFPEGHGDGVVGTWTGTQSSPAETTTIEMLLRADGTARIRQTGSLAADDEATWRLEAPYAVITFSDPVRSRAFPVLPGVALGEWMYERLP